MTDMSARIFEEQPFGKIALQKIGNVPDNFRLYHAAWMGDDPIASDVMRVTGAEFRMAKRGPEKGLLSVIVPNTKRTVYVTAAEMRQVMEA
ncbi:hypothetical protein [Chrysiogenes arsenatis]|uniref:hypothetical protein n=1 Tax=Chrysiogenes arsenatis TaxID=309797 RepID=UPI0003F90260|nr:hypothetical protein [Chrysiogenes arsenatis]